MLHICKKCNTEKSEKYFYKINIGGLSTCKKCVSFQKSTQYHLKKNPEKLQLGPIDRFSELLIKCDKIYHGVYSFESSIYLGSLKKMSVLCKIHGDFLIRPRDLLKNHGCPKCGNINKGYNKKRFVKDDKISRCYIIICEKNEEKFIKIGITNKKLEERFNSYTSMPYKYREYSSIEGDPYFIWELEKKLHLEFKNYRYNPSIPFCGSKTECFNINIEKLEYITKHSYNFKYKLNN